MPKLETFYRNLSIRKKVMFVTCAASIVALAAVACGLYLLQSRNFRRTYQQELTALAQVIAENCAPALAANDPGAAAKIMGPLRVKPEISNAAVLGIDGSEFARFGHEDECPAPDRDSPPTMIDRGPTWTVVEPIQVEGKRIGTFFFDANYARPRGEMRRLYLEVTAAVIPGALLLVALLTVRLQDLILGPIRRLAKASEAVARDRDYSVRVPASGTDELGQLTSTFNRMLARIEEQDGRLQITGARLQEQLSAVEQENAERKRVEAALRDAEMKFRGLVEQLPAITYHATLGEVCTWSYVSPQVTTMLGFTPEEWLASDQLWFNQIHPEDRTIPIEAEAVAIKTGKFLAEYRMFTKTGDLRWFRDQAVFVPGRDECTHALYGVLMDISEAKDAESRLAELNSQLVATSRQAGMAEVATGVLHNVGNVLNSVNVSAGIVAEKLKQSKLCNVARVASMLTEKNGSLASFLTEDPAGIKLPGYLSKLSTHLIAENESLIREVQQLGQNIEHIKEVVAMQQSYAKVSGVFENMALEQLVEDAIAMNNVSFERHGVTVERRMLPSPPARVDRHKIVQILINLLRNAKYALDEVDRPDKVITIAIAPAGDRVQVSVADNGVGIAPENLDRIFGHGFTTRKDGHGFGLHSGALAATEMNGRLSVTSDGLGHGATFTLELPVAQSDRALAQVA